MFRVDYLDRAAAHLVIIVISIIIAIQVCQNDDSNENFEKHNSSSIGLKIQTSATKVQLGRSGVDYEHRFAALLVQH